MTEDLKALLEKHWIKAMNGKKLGNHLFFSPHNKEIYYNKSGKIVFIIIIIIVHIFYHLKKGMILYYIINAI